MDFRIMAVHGKKKFELSAAEEYIKPRGANCLMLCGRNMACGETFSTNGFDIVETNIGTILLKKTRRSKFFKLPTALKDVEIKIRFPDYYFKPGLHYHGVPEFGFIPLIRIPL